MFGVQQKVMVLFSQALIDSIFRYTISVWFGHLADLQTECSDVLFTVECIPSHHEGKNTHYNGQTNRVEVVIVYLCSFIYVCCSGVEVKKKIIQNCKNSTIELNYLSRCSGVARI